MEKFERYVSSKEVSEFLGINKDTLQRWVASNSIPCHRVGRLWKFKLSEIDEWVKNGVAGMVDSKDEV